MLGLLIFVIRRSIFNLGNSPWLLNGVCLELRLSIRFSIMGGRTLSDCRWINDDLHSNAPSFVRKQWAGGNGFQINCREAKQLDEKD